MEYQFKKNSLTGDYFVDCSMGHEVVARWLQEEVYTEGYKINQVIQSIQKLKQSKTQEAYFEGREFNIRLSMQEVRIEENSLHSVNDDEPVLMDDELSIYCCESAASCGLEDFEQLLLAWAEFTQ